MLSSVDNCQNRVSADQYHITVLRAQESTIWGDMFFFELSTNKLPVFNWSQAQLQVDFFAMFTSLSFEINYEFINGSFAFSLK